MKKFDAEFKSATNGNFPYLRYVRSEYSKSNKKLRMYFLAKSSVIDEGILNNAKKTEITEICKSLLPEGITFDIRFVKAYADEEVVRIKLMQFLTYEEPMVCQLMTPEDITITVDKYIIKIVMRVAPNLYSIFNNDDFREKLLDSLEENFVENITLELIERFIDKTEIKANFEKNKQNYENSALNNEIKVNADGTISESVNAFDDLLECFSNNIVVYEDMRLIKVTSPIRIYGTGHLKNMPGYICDIKETFESAVVCGTVTGFQKKDFANKNFNNPNVNNNGRFKRNTTDERLPIYIFSLNDTTGTFPVVVFPFDNNNSILDDSIIDGANLVCSGTLKRNNMGVFQLTAKQIWQAEPDFSSITAEKPKKQVKSDYSLIFPEKYRELVQINLSDLHKKPEITPFLKGKTFVVLDFETTGLDTSKVMIVEIGTVKIADGKMVETFATLVNPMCKIPPESTATHGITDEDVVNMPEFSEILPDFYKFANDAILVGHNILGYDFPILNRLATENGYMFDNQILDTLVIAKNQLSLPKYNLDALCKHFNISLENAHRALDDAVATAKCFMKLAEKL